VETTYDKEGRFLGRLADVFGDPTRRTIYRHLRESSAPLSAGEVAGTFGVHRTVARAHLERLSELGLVKVGVRRRAGGGRPAKTYELSSERLEVMLPPRRYERLARALLGIIDRSLPPDAAAAAALALGLEYGAQTALEVAGGAVAPPVRLAPKALVTWMDEAGYGVSLDDGSPGRVVVEVHNCVYRELAQEHPDVVCAYDRGTICGMLGVDPETHTQTHALSAGDEYCRHEFRR